MSRTAVLIAFALLTALAAMPGRAGPPSISFAVVPQQSASRLAELWTPILRQLSAATGYRFQFRTAPDIPAFERRVAAGEYDVAYMNPYHYTVFSRAPGYRALTRQAGKQITGILVVRKDSSVAALDELQGGELAFPAPAAFAASVLPRAELRGRGIAFTPAYVSSHDSVYRAVARGLYPAGGGIERTFNNLAPEVRAQLRVLWTTAGYTPHAFAAHPRLAPEVRERIRAALLGLNDSAAGREMLAAIKFKAMAPAQDADWDDVRALHITLLDNLAH